MEIENPSLNIFHTDFVAFFLLAGECQLFKVLRSVWRNDEINHIFHLHFAAVKYTYMITNICFEILNYRAVQNCFLSLRAVAICATYLNNSKQRNYRAVTICCNPLRCDSVFFAERFLFWEEIGWTLEELLDSSQLVRKE